MSLTAQERKRFRTIGHQLNPAVTVAGRGLEETVLAELERALSDHELIKIKLVSPDRQSRRDLLQDIATRTGSLVVQAVGNKALLYRNSLRPNPRLSNLLKSELV